MGIHEPMEDREARLPQRFVAMCVDTWRRFQQPPEMLAGAMLAHAVNLMIEDGGAEETAAILAGLAAELSTVRAIGHA